MLSSIVEISWDQFQEKLNYLQSIRGGGVNYCTNIVIFYKIIIRVMVSCLFVCVFGDNNTIKLTVNNYNINLFVQIYYYFNHLNNNDNNTIQHSNLKSFLVSVNRFVLHSLSKRFQYSNNIEKPQHPVSTSWSFLQEYSNRKCPPLTNQSINASQQL